MIKYVKNKLSSILPDSIKIKFANYKMKKRFDVIFEKGATAGQNTFFEGKNLLKQNARVYGSYIGFGTYISGNTKLNKAKIGRFCSIGQNVVNGFGIHPTDWVSTHPCFYSLQKQAGFTFATTQLFTEHKYIDSESKYHIKIDNDVWIGNDVKIMDGVSIGDGAIIATGSIVTSDVKPYTIVGGIPARLIRNRFDEKQTEALIKINWWNKDIKWLKKYYLDFNDVNTFIDRFE